MLEALKALGLVIWQRRLVRSQIRQQFQQNAAADKLAVKRFRKISLLCSPPHRRRNDHALYEETPYFAGALDASRLGTAIFSDAPVMLSNKVTDKTADALGDMGLYGSKRWVPGKGRKPGHMAWDQGTKQIQGRSADFANCIEVAGQLGHSRPFCCPRSGYGCCPTAHSFR